MLHKSLALARPVLVAFSLSAARCDAQYIDLISPGPPAMPSDYLHLSISYADTPAAVEIRLVNVVSPIVPLVNGSAYLRRATVWIPDSLRAKVNFRDRRILGGPGQPLIINFAPELDAGFDAINVALSPRRNETATRIVRDITITGPAGYSRSFTVHSIPEPTSALVALCGAAFAGRRLRRRRRA